MLSRICAGNERRKQFSLHSRPKFLHIHKENSRTRLQPLYVKLRALYRRIGDDVTKSHRGQKSCSRERTKSARRRPLISGISSSEFELPICFRQNAHTVMSSVVPNPVKIQLRCTSSHKINKHRPPPPPLPSLCRGVRAKLLSRRNGLFSRGPNTRPEKDLLLLR